MNKKLKIFILLAGLFILTACVVKNQSKAHYHIEEGQKIKDTTIMMLKKTLTE